MKMINLDLPTEEDAKAPRNTYLVYGPTGSGKTTFAGSFPRTVFLSEVSESGYESLRGLSDEHLFEPGVKPIVIGIEKMNDMAIAREVLTPFIQSGMIQTIVKDSLTYYADLYLTYLFEQFPGSGDNLKVYGALGRHLRDLRVRWHSMGCNVVSLCLAQDPSEGSPNGLPLIPGKESNKYGASCDFLLYMRHERYKIQQQLVDNYELHSKQLGAFVARARRAIGMSDLPSPLNNQTYATFIENLGYSVDATRAALPPYDFETGAKIAKAIDLKMKALAAGAAAPTPPVVAAGAQPKTAATPIKPHVPSAKPHVPNAPGLGRPAPAPIRR